MIWDQSLKDVTTLFWLPLLKSTFCMMNFNLHHFIWFQTLVGPTHYLFDWDGIWNIMSWTLILTNQFQERYVCFRLSIELFQSFFGKLKSYCPVFLFSQNFHDPEMNLMTHISLNCFLDSSCKISQNEFCIEPRDPHGVFILDTWQRVDSFLEIFSDVNWWGSGKKWWYVEKMTLRSWIGQH